MMLLSAALVMSAQSVGVVSSIDSVQILIGDQAHISLKVNMGRGQKLVMPEFKRSEMITPGVEVLEITPADTTSLDNDMISVERVYTVTSFDDSLYSIPPMEVSVDGKKYHSGKLALKVLTIEVDTAHAEKFFPAKDVQDNPFQWGDISTLFWLALLMLALLLVVYYMYLILSGKKPVLFKVKFIRKLLPHQKAMKEIEQLKASRMTVQENPKEYYTRLTDTLRKYIEERFGFSAMEMTSSEIIQHLQESGDRKMIDELNELFQTADLVKFAKYSTLINENDMNLVNAIEFINTTKQENQPVEEKVVPELTAEEQKTRKSRVWLKAGIWICSLAALALLVYIVYSLYLL